MLPFLEWWVGGEANNVSGFEEGIFHVVLPKPPHEALTEVQLAIVLSILQTLVRESCCLEPWGYFYNVQFIISHGKIGKWIFSSSCHLKNRLVFIDFFK